MRMPQVRGLHITLDRQIEHGGVHSTECRARFDVLWAQEAAAKVEEPAAGTAQASSSSSAPSGV